MGVVQRITRHVNDRKAFGSNPGFATFFFAPASKEWIIIFGPQGVGQSFFKHGIRDQHGRID
jgi:hypothetical protein